MLNRTANKVVVAEQEGRQSPHNGGPLLDVD